MGLLAASCCAGPGGSCAATPRDKLADFRRNVDGDIHARLPDAGGAKLIHVGHKLGAYMDYPHRICAEGHSGGMRKLSELMDRSFEERSANGAARGTFDGLELDVHPFRAPAPGARDLYVSHDEATDDVPPQRYAWSSLRGLLTHFRSKGYAARGKRLFVELKTQRTCIDAKLVTSYDERRVGADLIDLLKDFADLAPQLSLVSFSARALQAAHELASGANLPLRYYLIVGTTSGFIGSLGCRATSGNIPRFDTDQEILSVEWLTGIWFSPKRLPDYAATLNGLNDRRARRTPPAPPMRFMFSLYDEEWPKIVDSFVPREAGLENLEGVIHDACEDPSKCPTEIGDVPPCKHNSI